jgi:hypothetical protein
MDQETDSPRSTEPAWEDARKFVEDYLRSVRDKGAVGSDDKAKDVYETWRVFSMAVTALKRIQEGQAKAGLEGDDGTQTDDETENASIVAEHARRVARILAKMQGKNGGDEEE